MRYTYAKFKGRDLAKAVCTVGPVTISDTGRISSMVECGLNIKKAAFLVTLGIDKRELYPDYDEITAKYIENHYDRGDLKIRVEHVHRLSHTYKCLVIVGSARSQAWQHSPNQIRDVAFYDRYCTYTIQHETTIVTDGDGWLPVMPVTSSDVPSVISEVTGEYPFLFVNVESGYQAHSCTISSQCNLNDRYSNVIPAKKMLRVVGDFEYYAMPSVRHFYSVGKQSKRMIRESIRKFLSGKNTVLK